MRQLGRLGIGVIHVMFLFINIFNQVNTVWYKGSAVRAFDFDLKGLQVFVIAAQTGSMPATAKRLGFTQSKQQNAPITITITITITKTKNKSIQYKAVSDDYMNQRQLKKGVDGWVLLTSSIALVLSLVALASTFVVSIQAAMWSALFYLIMVTYFVLYSRHRLVTSAPEEEFDMIASAESELN